jgi:hypothetical protein
VTTSVEGGGKAEFRLTYEELLERHHNHYQHLVHVNLPQVRVARWFIFKPKIPIWVNV